MDILKDIVLMLVDTLLTLWGALQHKELWNLLPELSPYGIMHSLWLPLAGFLLTSALLFKKQPVPAALVMVVVAALYIGYYLAPMVARSLNGIVIFAVTLVASGAVAIYIGLIRSD